MLFSALEILVLVSLGLLLGLGGHSLLKRKAMGTITSICILAILYLITCRLFSFHTAPAPVLFFGCIFLIGSTYRFWNTKSASDSATFLMIVAAQLFVFPLVYLAFSSNNTFHFFNAIGFFITFIPFLFNTNPQKNCMIASTSMVASFIFQAAFAHKRWTLSIWRILIFHLVTSIFVILQRLNLLEGTISLIGKIFQVPRHILVKFSNFCYSCHTLLRVLSSVLQCNNIFSPAFVLLFCKFTVLSRSSSVLLDLVLIFTLYANIHFVFYPVPKSKRIFARRTLKRITLFLLILNYFYGCSTWYNLVLEQSLLIVCYFLAKYGIIALSLKQRQNIHKLRCDLLTYFYGRSVQLPSFPAEVLTAEEYNSIVKDKNCKMDESNEQTTPDSSEKLCAICMDAEVDCILLPCAHIVSCLECMKLGIKDCPICRKDIDKVTKVYFSS